MSEHSNMPVTTAEIESITQHCLRLLSSTAHLRQDAATQEAYVYAQRLFPSIRKLLISTLMHRRTLICVAGLQGVGKTTLVKNFYGLDDRYLTPTLDRGERLPILITEKEGTTGTAALALRIEEDGNGSHVQREVSLTEEEFAAAVKGTDEHIMYLELNVPFQHTRREDVSFLLLPGFEPKSTYWNDLIEFAVNSSDAAVFAFNETSFSNADNEDCLSWIEERFGSNLIYAITGSDGSSDDNAAVKETCLQTLKIPDNETDRVVCTGQYMDRAKNDAWIEAFKASLESYAFMDAQQIKKNSEYLYHEVNKLSDNLYLIQNILTQASDNLVISDFKNHAILKAFDEAVKKQRGQIEKNMEERFAAAKQKSTEYLEQYFEKRPKYSMVKRLFFGNDLKQRQKIVQVIEQSLKDGEIFLPDEYMGLALKDSLTGLDQPEQQTSLYYLMSSDVEKTDKGRKLVCGEVSRSMVNDICVLLSDPREGPADASLQCRDPKRLMRSMAEISTYYFSLNSYESVAEKAGLATYEPAKIDMVQEHVIEGAGASKKFVAGMAGIMGVDLLGDGAINMVSQIAGSLGVAVPVAGAVAIAAVGGGALVAVVRDLTRMQREDLTAASLAMGEVYDKFQQEAMGKYDRYTDRIRERMEDNIEAADPAGKQVIDVINAQREIAKTLDLLEKIAERSQESVYNPWGWK